MPFPFYNAVLVITDLSDAARVFQYFLSLSSICKKFQVGYVHTYHRRSLPVVRLSIGALIVGIYRRVVMVVVAVAERNAHWIWLTASLPLLD